MAQERKTDQNSKEKVSPGREQHTSAGPVDGSSREAYENKVFIGDMAEVNLLGEKDYNEYVRNTESKQDFSGYDDKYLDIIDYIIKITHHIWEERGIGVIYSTYHNDTVLYAGTNVIQGLDAIVGATLQTLHAFPDRRLIGENVVWSGNAKDGFYASHRILSTATNLGESIFGPATGRKLTFRSIADTVSKENKIYREWIVRDNLAIVQQLGFDPIDVARKMAAKAKASNPPSPVQDHFGLQEDRTGLYPPPVYEPQAKGFDIGDFILCMYNQVWQWRRFDKVDQFYSDHCYLHFIGNRHLAGQARLQGLLISLFSSVPRAKLIVERVTANYREDKDQWDVSVRWKLQGFHEGVGYLGSPSNKPVEITGITHHSVQNEKIMEEWTIFDGIDVLKQIVDVPEDEEA